MIVDFVHRLIYMNFVVLALYGERIGAVDSITIHGINKSDIRAAGRDIIQQAHHYHYQEANQYLSWSTISLIGLFIILCFFVALDTAGERRVLSGMVATLGYVIYFMIENGLYPSVSTCINTCAMGVVGAAISNYCQIDSSNALIIAIVYNTTVKLLYWITGYVIFSYASNLFIFTIFFIATSSIYGAFMKRTTAATSLTTSTEPTSQKVGRWPSNSLQSEIKSAITNFTDLRISNECYTYNNGVSKNLTKLSGTIPVLFKNVTYNIPITIWIQEDHPKTAPLCYVTPTKSMKILTGKHVSTDGRVSMPYLNEWKCETHDLQSCIQIMITLFGDYPPLVSTEPR